MLTIDADLTLFLFEIDGGGPLLVNREDVHGELHVDRLRERFGRPRLARAESSLESHLQVIAIIPALSELEGKRLALTSREDEDEYTRHQGGHDPNGKGNDGPTASLGSARTSAAPPATFGGSGTATTGSTRVADAVAVANLDPHRQQSSRSASRWASQFSQNSLESMATTPQRPEKYSTPRPGAPDRLL